jgi:catechol 2,3-dioxygenase-like lactoylglutathione lyase family enzyme
MSAEDQRPGAAYWIDHYVVPVTDVARWGTFYTNILGAKPRVDERPERAGRPIHMLFTYLGRECHVGGSVYDGVLTPGTGLPKYGWFIRQEEIDDHLRRLDANGVSHSDPIRTSEEGEEGTAIRFTDPDGNQLELWAPSRMPDGAMEGETSAKVGRIASAMFESRDLDKTTDFYSRFCGLDPLQSNDVPQDTVVFPLAAAGRLTFKRVDRLGGRTGGHAVYRALHTALVVRDDEFLPTLDRMYHELPEWDFDPATPPTLSADEAGELPARTGIHGNPIGPEWKRTLGRGDSFWDGDSNGYHFVPGSPVGGSMVSFEPASQRAFLEQRRGSAAGA